MRRCETLIATRGDLTLMRDKIKQTIGQEEESLAQFKEEQNEKILELRYTKIRLEKIIFESFVFLYIFSHTNHCIYSTVQNKMSFKKTTML